ncbi:hypothetical protein BMETH_1267_0 [methanotrophic bacterial endosymbiont of Bathymodiolus sp.]|nr:hypothetical protein BMETH_1267_0 [methanotrophic bacterial endosymbiont of Bathymodiolus sp.]
MQSIIKLSKLSKAIRERLLSIAPNGKGMPLASQLIMVAKFALTPGP